MRQRPVKTLKRRHEFLRLRGGTRFSCSAFVMEGKPRRTQQDSGAAQSNDTAPRIGYTVTKRMGNAVIRNTIKRRLRAAAAAVPDGTLRAGHDYVLIARPGALKRPFVELTNDLREALTSLHRPKQRRGPKRNNLTPKRDK